MNRMTLHAFVLICLCLACLATAQPPDGYVSAAPYSFHGEAQGGTLIIRHNKAKGVLHGVDRLEVETEKGEAAREVVRKIVAEIPKLREGFEIDDYIWRRQAPIPDSPVGWSFSLPDLYGRFATAGTETGLGIPKAPTNLSATFDESQDIYTISWHYPTDMESTLLCISAGTGNSKLVVANREHMSVSKDSTVPTKMIKTVVPRDSYYPIPGVYERVFGEGQGSRTDYVPDENKTPTIRLIAIQHSVVSNFAVLQLDGRVQIDPFIEYFTGNIAPNWTAWDQDPEAEGIVFLEGRKEETQDVDDGGFYQVVQASAPGAIGGIQRKFLGLIPGHTYRISARLSTLELDESDADWAVSFHAALDAPDKDEHELLTSEQLAGFAPLPNGDFGPDAACVGRFTSENPTDGAWEQCDSGDPNGMMSENFLVPEGVSSMTVWMRFEGGLPGDAVGMDWVALHDLGN